jgi:hypothetical protein
MQPMEGPNLEVTTETVSMNETGRLEDGKYIFFHRLVKYSCDAESLFDEFTDYLQKFGSDHPKYNLIYSIADLIIHKRTEFLGKTITKFVELAEYLDGSANKEYRIREITPSVRSLMEYIVQRNSDVQRDYWSKDIEADLRVQFSELLRSVNRESKGKPRRKDYEA